VANQRSVTYLDPKNIHIVGLDDTQGEDALLYDERISLDVDENLVKNIKMYGIQSPVICRNDDGNFVVVDGRQRVRAARQANEELSAAGEVTLKVPVITVMAEDRVVSGIMVSTNEIRRADAILTKARKAARLFNQGLSHDEVSISFGCSVQTVRNYLRLVQADPSVHTAIEEGKISASVGLELALLGRDEQLAELTKLLKRLERPTASAPSVDSGRKKKEQQGVKRAWVKKALDSDSASMLKPAQRAVLEWFATGDAPDDSWMVRFLTAVEEEAVAKAEERERKKAEAKNAEGKKSRKSKKAESDDAQGETTDEVAPDADSLDAVEPDHDDSDADADDGDDDDTDFEGENADEEQEDDSEVDVVDNDGDSE
jgi:ParB family chromosome partitioning protein